MSTRADSNAENRPTAGARKAAGAQEGGLKATAGVLLGVRIDPTLLDVHDAEGLRRLRVALLGALAAGSATAASVDVARKLVADMEQSVVEHLESQIRKLLEVIEQQQHRA
jgi:hypothetical protein